MAKKIMIICGSARKNGNTWTAANWAATGAREDGAEVEVVDASQLTIKKSGCLHCLGCQKSEEYRCVVGDDASSVVARMLEQDVVVFATPVYFGGFSSQIKQVIDRMYCLIKVLGGDYSVAPELKDVSLALIATAGGDENYGLSMVSSHMKGIAAGLGKGTVELLIPFSPAESGEMAVNTDVKLKAEAFGRDLAN